MPMYRLFEEGLLRFFVYKDDRREGLYEADLLSWIIGSCDQLNKGLIDCGFDEHIDNDIKTYRIYTKGDMLKRIHVADLPFKLPESLSFLDNDYDDFMPESYSLVKKGLLIKRTGIFSQDIMPALYRIVSLYDELVNTLDETDFPYCKGYIKKMNEAINTINIKDIGTPISTVGIYEPYWKGW